MSSIRFRDTVPEYEEKNGALYPKLKAPKSRAELSIKARRAIDMLNGLSPSALDVVNMSGLGERIWEEIADRADEREAEIMKAMRKNLPKNWDERVQALAEIQLEAQRQGNELIQELVAQLRKAAMTLPHLSDVREWQLP